MSLIFEHSTDPAAVAAYIAERLEWALDAEKEVLWLVPGGSAIGVAVQVAKLLAGHDTSRLSISLTDERYGEPGHADSNWKQLIDAGFSLPKAQLFPVLLGKNRADTTQDYANMLKEQIDKTDYQIGFFGIGPDGHTAGILPNSPVIDSTDFAADYDANFERITMTPPAIAKLDEAVVYAVGEAKWPVLDQLDEEISVDIQPAQFLKSIPKVVIFSDFKQKLGEETL